MVDDTTNRGRDESNHPRISRRRVMQALGAAGSVVGGTSIASGLNRSPVFNASTQASSCAGQLTSKTLDPSNKSVQLGMGVLAGDTVYAGTRVAKPPLLGVFDLTTNKITDYYEISTQSSGGLVMWGGTSLNSGSDIYFGVTNINKLYHLNTNTKKVSSVGDLNAHIWDLDSINNSEKVYVGVNSNNGVIEYDANTGELQNLGSVVAADNGVRSIAATAETVYAGAYPQAGLVAINRDTGGKDHILPSELKDKSFVYDLEASNELIALGTGAAPPAYFAVINREDYSDYQIVKVPGSGQRNVDAIAIGGKQVYFASRPSGTIYKYDTSSENLEALVTPVSGTQTRDLHLRNNTLIGIVAGGYIWEYNLNNKRTEVTNLASVGLPTTPSQTVSLAFLNNRVYTGGSRQTTIHNPSTGATKHFVNPGEAKAMMAVNGDIYQAIYPGALIGKYTPSRDKFNILARIGKEQHRPRAISYNKSTESLYIGTQPVYGKLGGALSGYSLKSNELTGVGRNIIKNQSIRAITSHGDSIYIGSDISGGTGAKPVADEAKLAAIDVSKKPSNENGGILWKKDWQITPVPEASDIGDLVVFGGLIYGTTQKMLFIVDPQTQETIFQDDIVAGVDDLLVRDSMIYGASHNTLYEINPRTREANVLVDELNGDWHAPAELVAGNKCNIFVIKNRDLLQVNVPRMTTEATTTEATASGGNGKAKMGDKGDEGDDSATGGNGKAKQS